MASPSLPSGEQRRGGYHCSICMGENQWDDTGKSVDEGQSRECGGGTLVENCFNAENSATDRRILASLERELQAAFRFEDDNGRLANSVWVVRILLGRLLQERIALGQAIKQFAKFQWHEIMCGMVKLNDLEDMVELPLNGSIEASPRNKRPQGGNDMEAKAGNYKGAPSSRPFSPEANHPGLR